MAIFRSIWKAKSSIYINENLELMVQFCSKALLLVQEDYLQVSLTRGGQDGNGLQL